MSVTMINVGNPHPLWSPQKSAGAAFHDDSGLFIVGLPAPTHEEMDAFQGPGRLGLMKHRRILILTLLFGHAVRLESPYHASLTDRLAAPSLSRAGEHRLLNLCLVDAPTGETVSMRASTISPHLTEMLQRHICRQVANPISMSDFESDLQDWDAAYPTSRSVIRASTWCKLGD